MPTPTNGPTLSNASTLPDVPPGPGGTRRRVWPATAGLTVVLVALGLVCTWIVADARSTSDRVDHQLRLASAYRDLQVTLQEQQDAVQRAVRSNASPRASQEDVGRYRRAAARVPALVARIQQSGTRSDRALVAYVVLQDQRYATVVAEVSAALTRGDPAAARSAEQLRGRDPFLGVLPLLAGADNACRDRATVDMTALHRRMQRAVVLLPSAFTVGLVLLLACWSLLLRLQRDLRRSAEAHRHRAEHDVLTGLANRARFRSAAVAALEGARGTGDTPAVLVLDLDEFKPVNDTYGHAVGDALLVEVARRVRGELRSDDLAARLGGDEFAVLLATADEDGLAWVRSRLRAAVREPYDVGAVVLADVGVSVGVALAGRDGADLEALLQHADADMYRDKASRRSAARPEDECCRPGCRGVRR